MNEYDLQAKEFCEKNGIEITKRFIDLEWPLELMTKQMQCNLYMLGDLKMSKKYQVKIINSDESFHAYLTHKNKTSWCKRIALKHMNEFISRHKMNAKLEEV